MFANKLKKIQQVEQTCLHLSETKSRSESTVLAHFD